MCPRPSDSTDGGSWLGCAFAVAVLLVYAVIFALIGYHAGPYIVHWLMRG